VVGNPLSFSNDEEGFHSLLRWIQSLQTAHALTAAIVGMEPTGHYWLNLSKWLSNRQFEVVLVNPHLVKKNKENRDNTPSKSDKKDALVIADMVKTATTHSLETRQKHLKNYVSFSLTATLW
jgi:transposase